MELKLKNKKITKIGGSKGFIIDAAYFKNKQIFEDQLYDLIIIPTSSKLSFESPNTLSEKHNSGGANPIIHECPMYRRKPSSKEEVHIQLKKEGVFKE